MKKVLLTASALSLLAGAAVADVSVGGDARFGLKYDDGNADETSVIQRVRVHFNMSTETDAGLTFGARVGLDSRSEEGVAVGANGSNFRKLHSTVMISGMGFEAALGNSNGAVVDIVGLWDGGLGFDATLARQNLTGGFDTDDESNQTLQVGYSFGDFSIAASSQVAGDTSTEFAAEYSANGITVAAGGDDDDNWAVSGSYASGDFVVGAIFRDGDVTGEQFRVWGNYSMGATKIGAVYTDMGDSIGETYAIGVAHSLGGGVTAHAGIGEGVDGDTEAQLGFTMGF
ncbi:porin [Aliiroseovarius sp. PTFE2010]|uniref:porin n=1 Tax=Aliiroseovarius sp. PTFE2010 TaxID=3417190 RepID=UPI003CF97632